MDAKGKERIGRVCSARLMRGLQMSGFGRQKDLLLPSLRLLGGHSQYLAHYTVLGRMMDREHDGEYDDKYVVEYGCSCLLIPAFSLGFAWLDLAFGAIQKSRITQPPRHTTNYPRTFSFSFSFSFSPSLSTHNSLLYILKINTSNHTLSPVTSSPVKPS